jgi:hypothetical protein
MLCSEPKPSSRGRIEIGQHSWIPVHYQAGCLVQVPCLVGYLRTRFPLTLCDLPFLLVLTPSLLLLTLYSIYKKYNLL